MKKRKIIGILLAFFSFIGIVHAQIDLLGVEEDLSSTQDDGKQKKEIIDSAKTEERSENFSENRVETFENEKVQAEEKAPEKKEVPDSDFPTNDLFGNEDLEQTDLFKNDDSTPKAGDFVNEYIQDIETARQAQQDARKILQNDPEIITLRQNQHKMIQKGDQKRLELKQHFQKTEEQSVESVWQQEDLAISNEQAAGDRKSVEESEEKQPVLEELKNVVTESYQAAPFGLYWGISHEELQTLGYELQPATHENYQNVYRLVKKGGENKVFQEIYGVFGVQDRLWGISSKSALTDDQPDASGVLNLYHQYYQALEKKYGNAKEFFEPYTYDELIDEEVQDEKTGEKKVQKVVHTKTNPLGGENFLEELRSGKASLYATFSNEEIGVTLDVFVSKEGQSQLILDYKNLKLMQEEKDKKFESLIKDL